MFVQRIHTHNIHIYLKFTRGQHFIVIIRFDAGRNKIKDENTPTMVDKLEARLEANPDNVKNT